MDQCKARTLSSFRESILFCCFLPRDHILLWWSWTFIHIWQPQCNSAYLFFFVELIAKVSILSELWAYYPSEDAWIPQNQNSSEAPCSFLHSATLYQVLDIFASLSLFIQDTMIVTGGIYNDDCDYDLATKTVAHLRSNVVSYNFTTRLWSNLTSMGFGNSTQLPLARFSHGSFLVSSTCLVIFGGGFGNTPSFILQSFSFTIIDDMWVFDIALRQWTKLNVSMTGATYVHIPLPIF